MCTYAFSLHLPSPSTSVRILFFKEDMTEIYFVNYCQSKKHTTLQNKETTVQSYQKCLNQNTKKSPGIEGALFNCTGKMGMDNFGCLNRLIFCSYTSSILLLFISAIGFS